MRLAQIDVTSKQHAVQGWHDVCCGTVWRKNPAAHPPMLAGVESRHLLLLRLQRPMVDRVGARGGVCARPWQALRMTWRCLRDGHQVGSLEQLQGWRF